MSIKLRHSIISLVLTLAIASVGITPAFASAKVNANIDNNDISTINANLHDSNVHFLKISENQNVYTFERDGKEYKYVDNIIGNSDVKTQMFVKQNGKFAFYDEVSYHIDSDEIILNSKIKGVSTNSTTALAKASYKWKLKSQTKGSTSIRNMSITAIALALGTLVGGVSGACIAVAAYLFDKNIKTVYYTAKTYRDLNSSVRRPTFKYVCYTFTDSKRTKATNPKSSTAILKP